MRNVSHSLNGTPDAECAVATSSLVGARLDSYEILEHLGEGAMCAVYRARHVDLHAEFAIKVLHAQRATDRIHVQRLRREAAVALKIDHPNIVKVVEFGMVPGLGAFLVMELLRGRTLLEVITEDGPLPPARAAWIARETASGLSEAHKGGYVHRDLKPGNLMLVETSSGQRVKILDFGIVGVSDNHHGETQLTEENLILGTPSHMAPEQFESPVVGPAADLYALGAILYHMLAGRPPFVGSMKEIIAQHLVAAPDRLPSCGGLDRLTHWLLEKDPRRRPESAARVVDTLDRLHPGLAETRAEIALAGWPPEPPRQLELYDAHRSHALERRLPGPPPSAMTRVEECAKWTGDPDSVADRDGATQWGLGGAKESWHALARMIECIEWALVLAVATLGVVSFWHMNRRELRRARRYAGAALIAILIGVVAFQSDLAMQKLVSYLIMPCGLLWIALGALTIRLLTSESGESKRSGAIAAVLFTTYTVLGNGWFAGILLTTLEGRIDGAYTLANSPSFDAVFVLGGSTGRRPDGIVELSENGDRVILAARLYRSGKTPILVASGSSIGGLQLPQDLSEDTEQLWIELGVPKDAIRRLPNPRNSAQEVEAYKELIEREGWRRVGVVSSAWHLPRVLRHCKKVGVELIPIAADHRAGLPPLHPAYLIPQPGAWKAVQLVLWEVIGMAVGR